MRYWLLQKRLCLPTIFLALNSRMNNHEFLISLLLCSFMFYWKKMGESWRMENHWVYLGVTGMEWPWLRPCLRQRPCLRPRLWPLSSVPAWYRWLQTYFIFFFNILQTTLLQCNQIYHILLYIINSFTFFHYFLISPFFCNKLFVTSRRLEVQVLYREMSWNHLVHVIQYVQAFVYKYYICIEMK